MSKMKGYQFADGPIKHMMRNEILRHVTDYFDINRKRKLSGFTLPADSLIVEKQLHEYYGNRLSLLGVEKDPSVYKRAQKIIKASDIPMKLTLESDASFWERNSEEFNFIWLDYCGPFCNSKKNILSSIAQGDHLKLSKTQPALLAITLLDTMDLWAIEELRLAVKKDAKKEGWKDEKLNYMARLGGIPRLLNDEARKAKNTLKPLISYRYIDKLRNNKACPMRLFICEIEKGVHKYDVWNTPSMDLESDIANRIRKI